MACKYIYKGTTYTKEQFESFVKENLVKKSPENQFLSLLEKDSNWVTFFIKSIIQDSAKKGYEKVLFPSGNTASKVEGHTTLEEFKKQKEDRITELEKQKIDNKGKIGTKRKTSLGEYVYSEENYKEDKENIDNEINQLKQELERVEREGFGALKPIYNFYENTVTNILKKNYKINKVTDEYGNTWNEITISPEMAEKAISLQIQGKKQSTASPETIKLVKEVIQKMGVQIQDLAQYAKSAGLDTTNINGIADLGSGIIAVAQGKENVALTEEMVHIATQIMEQTNPQLITALISKIDRFKIYKQVLNQYKDNKYYKNTDGSVNIRKIKKEAVDKLLVEVIINKNEGSTEFPELMEESNRSIIKQWWDAILDWINSIYTKTNIELFEETAEKIFGTDIGTIRDIKKKDIYLQEETKKAISEEIMDSFKSKEKPNERKFNRPTNLPEGFRVLQRTGVDQYTSIFSVTGNDRHLREDISYRGGEKTPLHISYYKGVMGRSFKEILSLHKRGTDVERTAQRYGNLRVLQSLLQTGVWRRMVELLGVSEVRIVNKGAGVPTSPLFVANQILHINQDTLEQRLYDLYDKGVNIDEYLDMAVFEELIHLTALKLHKKEDFDTAAKELSFDDKLFVDNFYKDGDKSYNLTPYQSIHELIRMKVQKDLAGKSTEDIVNQNVINSIVNNIWEFLLDLFRTKLVKSNKIAEEVKQFIIKNENQSIFVSDDSEILGLAPLKNEEVDLLYNTIIDRHNRLKLIPETKDKKRHYLFDDVEVKESVTERVKKDSKFPERTGVDKELDSFKAEFGDRGHLYLKNYIEQNWLDKDGYRLESPRNEQISTELPESLISKLKTFADELILSYPDGTRFLVEKRVVNERIKGKVASTMDFVAIIPTEDGAKVDILDWKFTSINKNKEDDIPWYKQKEWNEQMKEYTHIIYNYGLKPQNLNYARMHPFIINWEYKKAGDKTSGLIPKSFEIGKIDNPKETNLYLLSVPIKEESTKNPEIDKFIKSLTSYYEELYKLPVSPEDKHSKDIQLNQLSKAIRKLHVQLDFTPLVDIGKGFLRNSEKSITQFENLDYDKLTDLEISNKLRELLELEASALKFTNLDDLFLSENEKDQLTDDQKKLLTSLEQISASTRRMLDKIEEIKEEYTKWIAVKTEVVDTPDIVLEPEKEIQFLSKTFLEGSKLPSRIINVAQNLILRAKSEVDKIFSDKYNQFSQILLKLEKEAKLAGKTAFEMIGQVKNGELALIQKLDPEFIKKFNEARENKDKKWILENINKETYNKLSSEFIKTQEEKIKKTFYSEDEKENDAKQTYHISQLRDSLDLDRVTFNGFNKGSDYHFKRFFYQSLKEGENLSKEYKEMIKYPSALEMWDLFSNYNNKAAELGYFKNRSRLSFFPLIEATIAEKLAKTSDVLNETQGVIKDLYTIRIEEEARYSKIDPKTGKVVKQIPKLFTRTNKAVHQLSTDLNKIGALWIKSLMDYEANRELESSLLTLYSVEKAKGHLLVDDAGNVIEEAGKPKIDKSSNKNAEILQAIIDDSIYGLRENLNSVGNIGLSKTVETLKKGTEEEKEQTKLSVRKTLENGNKLTRSLAVGWKLLVTIPNYVGVNMQAYINAGNLYTKGQFFKNEAKVMNPVAFSTKERALIDVFVPLNENLTVEKRRELAKKQGFLDYLSTWSFYDVMMVTNSWPEKKLQLANSLSILDNTIVQDGKLYNAIQYLEAQDRKTKYNLPFSERQSLEKSFDSRLKDLIQEKGIDKFIKYDNEKAYVEGVSDKEIAKYRLKMIEFGRNLNGQMNENNKADYRRDTILNSFMMFKNWMPKQIGLRTLDIKKNVEVGEWEYGRTRAFFKLWKELGTRNILDMRNVLLGNEEGIKILKKMIDDKREAHYKKNGTTLEITDEEFYDLMRRKVNEQLKELLLLFGLLTLLLSVMAAAPDDEDDKYTLNRYKFWRRAAHKIYDELWFYYSPMSAESMTRGSILPPLMLLSKIQRFTEALGKEVYGQVFDNEDLIDKSYPLKYFLDLIPGPSQFDREILPLVSPETAKNMGIKPTGEARAFR